MRRQWLKARIEAEGHARWVCHEYGLILPATLDDLEAICEDKGFTVQWVYALGVPGVFFGTVEGTLIVLRDGCGPHVLAHELNHALFRDRFDAQVIHQYTTSPHTHEERVAQYFEWFFCGHWRGL